LSSRASGGGLAFTRRELSPTMNMLNKLKDIAVSSPPDSRKSQSEGASLKFDLSSMGESARIKAEEAAGSSFHVRVGPNYPKNGLKAASAESLFELVSVDLFTTEQCAFHLAESIRMPAALPDGPGLQLPQLLLVTVQVPQESPGLFSGAQDKGSTLTAAFTFHLRKEAIADAASATPSAAVRLLARYYERATSDQEVKKTFKMIGRARNFDQLGLPGWMKRFNGKPVIIHQSGEVFAGRRGGVRYLQEDVLVGRWSLWAKQGVHTLMPRYSEIDAEIGFVLQGNEDDELPEQMLGAARLPFIDVSSFPALPGVPAAVDLS